MFARFVLLGAALAAVSSPQELLKPGESLLPPALTSGKLDCHIEKYPPFLDFFFRFEANYLLSCPVKQFEGKATKVETVLHVYPQNGYPVTLGSFYQLPAIPDEIRDRVDLKKLKAQAGASEGFSLGEGEYRVELLAFDDRHREFRHSWNVHAERSHAEADVPMTLSAGGVAPLTGILWAGEHNPAPNRKLTIFLNAAPLSPHATKLRAWDRAFLLGSLGSVLRGLSYSSVRLVAFNLDQQKEIYRSGNFDQTGMLELERAMQQLELGTVSIRVVNETGGWIELLRSMIHEERVRQDKSDAILFLGPWSRLNADRDRLVFAESSAPSLHFYSIEYYGPWQRGAEFPDGIQRLVREQDGTCYRIHSPGELAQAVQRLNGQLQKLNGETSAKR